MHNILKAFNLSLKTTFPYSTPIIYSQALNIINSNI